MKNVSTQMCHSASATPQLERGRKGGRGTRETWRSEIERGSAYRGGCVTIFLFRASCGLFLSFGRSSTFNEPSVSHAGQTGQASVKLILATDKRNS